LDQPYACSAEHSALSVGFESANIMGRFEYDGALVEPAHCFDHVLSESAALAHADQDRRPALDGLHEGTAEPRPKPMLMPLALISPKPRMRPPVDMPMKRGLPFRPVLQNFGDAPLHVASDAHAARASVDATESEIGISYGWIVEDGDETHRIGHHDAVEQVPVRQPR
jgi:hypothetical protein